jgi:hypothetical protein
MYERHSIHYNNLPAMSIIFDIYIKEESRWMNYEEKEEFSKGCGDPIAPKLMETFGTMSLDMIIKHFIESPFKSEFGVEDIEGIVIKNYEKNLFGKIIRTEFTEQLNVYYRDRNKLFPEKMKFNWIQI